MHWTKGRCLALGCLVVGAVAALSASALAASTLEPSPIQKAAPATGIRAPQGPSAPPPASQASTILMTIPGIAGEGPGGEIVVQSFQEAQAAPRDVATGQATGKRQHEMIIIKKTTDKASPQFFKNCVAGAHYKSVTVEMRKAGGTPATSGAPFLKFEFKDVLVSSVRTLDGGAQLKEVRFSYQSMQKQ